MRFIADLHVHSHYSRATSKDLNLESLYQWAKIKGINVIGTGDFTHPAWFSELKEKLEPDGNGFYLLKDPPGDPGIPGIRTSETDVRFCLTTEISSIYKHGDRVRKNHNLVYAPDLDTVARINHRLAAIGNLEADGRPILGLPSRDLLEIVLESSDRAHLIPAHVWTPWFSTLGSKAGYDSIEACFRDLTGHLFALETGLSSDPAMNRKLSSLDGFTLISNSDAHSPAKLGREANLLDTELSYDGMFEAFKTGDGFTGTYEFFPEEGKYHHDGHRKCNIHFEPNETKKYNSICPECGKPLTVGVLHRVEDLADREKSKMPDGAAGYHYIIPLPELLSEIEDVGPNTKTVRQKFQQVITNSGNEFALLRDIPVEDIERQNGPVLAEAVRRLRKNEVILNPGYDGVYGVIKVFEEGEIDRIRGQLGFFGVDEYKTGPEEQKEAQPDASYGVPNEQDDTASTLALNDEQLRVIGSGARATLVTAGPGTGKTHTLVEWIAGQTESDDVAHSQILAVTFTNKAADELRERLAGKIGPAARDITIGTFHAIAWQLLREHNRSLNTIFDRASRRMALRFLYPGMKGSERTELDEQLARHFELGAPLDETAREAAARYRDYLEEQGGVDLADLISQAVDALESNPAWKTEIRQRYRVVAIDEFQDINPVQYDLVRAMCGGEEQKLLAIGDPDQAIYGFRGADLSLFFRFAGEFNAGKIALSTNYRSSGAILDAAGSLIRNNRVHAESDLDPIKKWGSPIRVFRAGNPFEEADFILDQIEQYVGGIDSLATAAHTDSTHTYGFGDIAVLYRTNAVGEALFKSFLKSGIPVHFGDGSSFLSDPPFTIITHLFQLLNNPSDRIALGNLLADSYGWGEAQIASLIGDLESRSKDLFGDDPVENIAADLKRDLTDLRLQYRELSDCIDQKNGVGTAMKQLMEHYLPDAELAEEQRLKKETLLELAGDWDGTSDAFLEKMQLNPYTDAGRIKSEGVRLLTFHAAKGLEFPVVFIAAAEEEIAPLLRQGTDMEEERRLFYVAMTRAEEELQITWSAERSRYGEIRKMEPSRFITEIPELLREDVAEPKKKRKESDQSSGKQMGLF